MAWLVEAIVTNLQASGVPVLDLINRFTLMQLVYGLDQYIYSYATSITSN